MALSELANCHFYVGNFDQSDALNRRVLALDKKLHGEKHPHVADDLINLAAVQFEKGRYPEAEKYQREAVTIFRDWYGSAHPETASALTHLGRSLASDKKYDEASAVLQESLVTQEQIYGKVHPRVASALNELGRVAQAGGRLDEAEADFRRMADIYDEVHHGKSQWLGVALSNLAGVAAEKKQYEKAEGLFRQALKISADYACSDAGVTSLTTILGEHSLDEFLDTFRIVGGVDLGHPACDGPVASGANIDTSTPGPHSFTVNARDIAVQFVDSNGDGTLDRPTSHPNTSTLTHHYFVPYPFGGFQRPVERDLASRPRASRPRPSGWRS